MFRYGVGLEDVRAALASANANSPKGAIEDGARRFQLYTNDQASHASEYRPLVVAYRNGSAVLLSDVADVEDSVQDLRNEGRANGEPSVFVIMSRQPGANIIDTVDQVKAELPQLQASLPSDVNLTIVSDRSATIRASLRDTKWTLMLAVALVTFVVFLSLGDVRAALVPAVVVPVSLIGTFSGMYLLGFSLDNLSLMALTIATGFVVDDAIVVLENISRHVEAGCRGTRRRCRAPRNGLHRHLDQRLAGGGVHSHPAHGRHRRAAVPGIHGHAVARHRDLHGDLAHHDADDVRPDCCDRGPRARAGYGRTAVRSLVAVYERTLAWSLGTGGG